jgi:cyclophilin family peptidyl-prolyl cis-trans isomerase
MESLEGRTLLNASILPISNVTVPQTVGLEVPVMAGAGAPANQVFTVTTSNNNITATVAQGKFLTINVTHASSGAGDPAFSGALVFQLFEDLTPLTASKIEQLVQNGFYTNNSFFRVANMFPGANDYIVQGGSPNNMGGGTIGLPGFPFQDEFAQQLVYTGMGQLAMANAFSFPGGWDTNSSQFFITTGQPRSLDMQNPIFGQLVSGFNILTDMTKVATTLSPVDNAQSLPKSPITITTATLSNTNPNGVIHINAKGATQPAVTNVTVTATDPVTHTTASRTFQVSVVPNNDPMGNPINQRAFVAPVANTNPMILPNTTYTLQLQAGDAEPTDTLTYMVQGGVSTSSGTAAFTAVQNATATVSATGLVTVTPSAGFVGDIPLVAGVRDQIDRSGTGNVNAPQNFDMHKIRLHVTRQTAGVRVINTANNNELVVTPPPRTDGKSNSIVIDEQNGNLLVGLNGVVDPLQPAASGINRIVVYGGTANDQILVTQAVDPTIPVTLDGGHGGLNIINAGNGVTREHGWFGFNILQGGAANDFLIGQRGHVHFVKSAGTDLLYAGVIPTLRKRSTHHIKVRIHHFSPTSGTLYAFVGNKLVPLRIAEQLANRTTTTSTTSSVSAAAAAAAHDAAVRAAIAAQNKAKPKTSSGH